MMLKCLKILKINLNSNVNSYFNILRYIYFLKIIIVSEIRYRTVSGSGSSFGSGSGSGSNSGSRLIWNSF